MLLNVTLLTWYTVYVRSRSWYFSQAIILLMDIEHYKKDTVIIGRVFFVARNEVM